MDSVVKLRNVVTVINVERRKSVLICAHCHRVSTKGGEWIKVNQADLEALSKPGNQRIICPDCELLFR